MPVMRGLCLLAVLACAGCGDKRRQAETKNDLFSMALQYHNFHDSHSRGPHGQTEFLAYEDPAARGFPLNAATQSTARKAIQSGNYIIIWDVGLELPPERNADKIMIYHRDVPEKGGLVCFADGHVAELTKEEFERTPKAKPKHKPDK